MKNKYEPPKIDIVIFENDNYLQLSGPINNTDVDDLINIDG